MPKDVMPETTRDAEVEEAVGAVYEARQLPPPGLE